MWVDLSLECNPKLDLISEESSLTFPLLLFLKLPLLFIFYFVYFIKVLHDRSDRYPFLAKTDPIFQSLPKLLHIFQNSHHTIPYFPINLDSWKPDSISCHFQDKFWRFLIEATYLRPEVKLRIVVFREEHSSVDRLGFRYSILSTEQQS